MENSEKDTKQVLGRGTGIPEVLGGWGYRGVEGIHGLLHVLAGEASSAERLLQGTAMPNDDRYLVPTQPVRILILSNSYFLTRSDRYLTNAQLTLSHTNTF